MPPIKDHCWTLAFTSDSKEKLEKNCRRIMLRMFHLFMRHYVAFPGLATLLLDGLWLSNRSRDLVAGFTRLHPRWNCSQGAATPHCMNMFHVLQLIIAHLNLSIIYRYYIL